MLVPAHGGPTPGPDQDIPSRIAISVVQGTALATYPGSYSQPIDSSRTTQGPASRTGDAGVSLADDFKASGRLFGFVFQEPSEHPPA